MTETTQEEQTQQEQPQKRKRRTKAEIEAERAGWAPEFGSAEAQQEHPLPPSVTQSTSVVDAIAALAINGVDPAEYSDIYTLMKECIRVKRHYNLSDNKFMELMNRFDDRTSNDEDGRRRRR